MKTYVKPELFYEDFDLTQSIAGGCAAVVNSANTQDCTEFTLKDEEEAVWGPIIEATGMFLNPASCSLPLNDVYCYTAASDNDPSMVALFIS